MRLESLTQFVGVLFLLGGCAGMVRTEGTSGALAWRVTDPATVTRNIRGQPVDTYDFTLVIKNVSDRAITLTRMHRTVYHAGGGQPGSTSVDGRWDLPPGGERAFPLYSYRYCVEAQGCLDRGGAQPLWQIVFTGADAQGRPIQARLDIALPPQAPKKHADFAAMRRSPTSLVVGAPTWSPGDEWRFRWESPAGRGTFVWSVDREEPIDGVPNYVVKTGTREIFYRKSDMAMTRETVDGAPVLVSAPPRLRYVWPLAIGQMWTQTVREERPAARQTTERADVVTVEAEETVSVPAGTFTTLKIVCRNKGTGAIRYEEWYAPELRHWVLLRERLPSGLRVRELTGFSLR